MPPYRPRVPWLGMLAFAFFLFSSRATVPAATSRLKAGDWSIEMGTSGSVSSFLFDGQVVGHAIGRPPVSLALGNQEIRPELEGAVELIRGGIRCRLVARTQPWVDLVVTTTFRKEAGLVVLRRELEISAAGKLLEDLTVRLPQLPFEFTEKTWLPLKDGRGVDFGAQRQAVYRFSGAAPATGHRLALPLMTFQASEPWGRVTVIADPYFSTVFKRDTVEWTYPKAIGLADPVEKRSVATVFQKGPPDAALDAFFALAVPEIEKGPDWLRDIAMVDYDYMSDAGTGWSRDLAALAAALPRGDRGQVLCCLHGWYDWVGRYSLDRKTHRFDPAWANFGAYERVKDNHATMKRGNVDVDIGFAKCVPTRLTAGMIRGRLAEAKAKGFRTAIYFADGMNAGDGLPDFSTNKVLRWGGWGGPDISGKTYVMNPLHPDVAPLFHELMSVVLSEFGDEVDALVWDETFHVGAGDLGTSSYPGYADRAMMRLTRDLTLQVQDYNRRHGRKIAFLASDAIGPTAAADAPPYAIMAHGTYQDSHCDPGAWSYGIFPNYRNVLWSCCWWPVSKWNWVEYGVRTFFAPVAISNGWGDNLGFGEMTPEQRGRVLQLFEWRKSHRGYPHWLYTLPILLPELGK